MKNLLLCGLLALLLAPGAVASEPSAVSASPAVSEDQPVPQSSACKGTPVSLADLKGEALAKWLDRTGFKPFEPDAAQRMAVPACPDITPCAPPCEPGDGPCFFKPLGAKECCTPEGCFQCEGGTEIFVVTCPCFGAGCPRRSLELECG